MKKIAVLGSTGSIGTQTLEIVRTNQDIKVTALAAGNNIELLEQQIREFSPKVVAVWKEERAKELKEKIRDLDVKVLCGMDGLLAVAAEPEAEILVTAIVGMIGILPTIEAIRAGKDIALANKETLVTAGHIIIPLAKKMGVSILPVDSEHSAIFQSLQGNEENSISKILLTASGGPFRGRKKQDLLHIQVEDALKHPNWSMGHKVTIDSSTLVNKGLEVIEARWLFDFEPERIQVVVHPQSVIHSMVQYADGVVIAQMGAPDMRNTIAYSLGFPERLDAGVEPLNFSKIKTLTFEEPDLKRFPQLGYAYDALKLGGAASIVLNAANEIGVEAFIQGKIGFTDIARLCHAMMYGFQPPTPTNLEEILETDKEARKLAQSWLEGFCDKLEN